MPQVPAGKFEQSIKGQRDYLQITDTKQEKQTRKAEQSAETYAVQWSRSWTLTESSFVWSLALGVRAATVFIS